MLLSKEASAGCFLVYPHVAQTARQCSPAHFGGEKRRPGEAQRSLKVMEWARQRPDVNPGLLLQSLHVLSTAGPCCLWQ